jgi:hypothetical protein
VTTVQADGQAGFLVHTATGLTWHTAGLVAATGSFGHLHLPAQDQFTGRLQHLASYRSPHDHAGERSVVDTGKYQHALETGQVGRRPCSSRPTATVSPGRTEHPDTSTPCYSPSATAPTWTTSAPLRALDGHGLPQHAGGISVTHPGLVYVRLEFQRSFSSNTLRGVYRDAEHVITLLAAHVRNAPAAAGLRL